MKLLWFVFYITILAVIFSNVLAAPVIGLRTGSSRPPNKPGKPGPPKPRPSPPPTLKKTTSSDSTFRC